MGLLNILHNAYSTQRKTNHRHKKTDSVYLLGATAGTLCITTGGFMFAFLSIIDAAMYSLMGLFWVVYGLVCFLLLGFYEDGKNTAVGHMFLVLGVLGAFLGVGFFLGGILMAITGVLVLMYAKK